MWLQGLTCSAVKQSVSYPTSKIHPDFPNFLLQFAWLTRICNTARTLPLDWLTLFKRVYQRVCCNFWASSFSAPWEDVCQRAGEDLLVKPQIRKGKEPFQASNQDASWAHPRWDLLGMSHQDEAGEQTQVRLEQLHLLAGFWTSWCPPEELEKMVERGRSGLCLDCCPRDLDTWQKMYGLMDNKSEEAD